MSVRMIAALTIAILFINGALGEETAPPPANQAPPPLQTPENQPPPPDKAQREEAAVKVFLKGFSPCDDYASAVENEAKDDIRQFVHLSKVLWMISGVTKTRHKEMDNQIYYQLNLVTQCLHNPQMRFGEAAATLLTGEPDWLALMQSGASIIRENKHDDR